MPDRDNGAGPVRDDLKAPALRLYRRYRRIILMAYGGLLAGLSAFFTFELHHAMALEVAQVEGQVARHAQFLEFVLRASAEQVEALRQTAGTLARQRPACADLRGSLERAAAAGPGRSADDADAAGRPVLSGLPRVAERGVDFACDLHAALGLSDPLRGMGFVLPNAASGRFRSMHGFQLEWPAPSTGLSPDPQAAQALWRQAQPAANPGRARYWGAAFSGGTAGLLVPVAAPAYDGNRFMGLVSVDLSLAWFERANASFGYPIGQLALVDGRGQVIAHPLLRPESARAALPFDQVFEPRVLPSAQDLLALPSGHAVRRGGMLLVRRGFAAAPWQLVFEVPTATLWRKLLRERGADMGAVLAALALLMGFTYRLVAREFIAPASRLVSHVVAGAEGQPQRRPADVPAGWRPWFDAIGRAFRESRQFGHLQREVDVAAQVQRAILPTRWPDDGRFTLWGTMRPARDVGGDFYDHFPLADGRHGVVVADVSGKGISAGMFGMMSKTLTRAEATRDALSPGEVALRVNRALCADNEAGLFVTAFYACYDAATGAFDYACAGHPPPLLLRADGQVQWLGPTGGAALGVLDTFDYGHERARLGPGDVLLVYTDGVTDALDAAMAAFGTGRLVALFDGRPPLSAREAVERVLAAVGAFSGEGDLADDVTCVALRCELRAVG